MPLHLLLIALLASAYPVDPTQPDQTEHPVGPVVATVSGSIRGESVAGRGAVFRGIPYAQPPTGARRWRPPAPARPWSGVRDATVFGPPCPQGTGTADYYRRVSRRLGTDPGAVRGIGPGSEDCLSLNVWTPSLTPPAPVPVLVWVHGGGGVTGSGSDPLFRGEDLTQEGLVVVTLNYRLGALGFLAHPALSAESPRRTSGNYGLLDLIRALTWVRDNIGAFGGDPGRVTLAGQSAGANLVETLMVSPPARGLFQRAISHSATALDARPLRGEAGERRTAEGAGRAFAERLGLDTTATAAELRRIPVDSLVAAAAGAGQDAPSGAVVDGVLLPDAPGRLWARGAVTPVPLLKGSNSDEFALLMPPVPLPAAEYRAWVGDRFGEAADAVLRSLPPDPDPNTTHRQRVRLLSDDAFGVPMVRLVRWADGRLPVWLYRFDWHPGDGVVGAFHSVEIPFLFDTREAVGWWPRDAGVRELTRAIQAAWARFAATGMPAGPGLPPWPRATVRHPLAMILDEDPEVRPLPRADLLRVLADDRPQAEGR